MLILCKFIVILPVTGAKGPLYWYNYLGNGPLYKGPQAHNYHITGAKGPIQYSILVTLGAIRPPTNKILLGPKGPCKIFLLGPKGPLIRCYWGPQAPIKGPYKFRSLGPAGPYTRGVGPAGLEETKYFFQKKNISLEKKFFLQKEMQA